MEGIIHADLVNTVSPTYAQEIMTTEFGAQLEPILQSLSGKISGIINGIDTKYWDPQTDPNITANYSIRNWQTGKQQNKLSLQKLLKLPESDNTVLFSYIGRLDPGQKGVDLIIEALYSQQIKTPSYQFVFLGQGESELENRLRHLSNEFPNICTLIEFNETLAHHIYAASDFLVIPSKFEPCGLTQLIAMRYGAIPIIRKTGGLADTVKEEYTGFVFSEYTYQALIETINKAITWFQDFHLRDQIIKNCMEQDFSWTTSALEYEKLYQKLIDN